MSSALRKMRWGTRLRRELDALDAFDSDVDAIVAKLNTEPQRPQ